MSPEDKRLVAALNLLHDQLPPLVEEILAGQLDQDERRAFALVLSTIAAELDPGIMLPDAVAALPRGTGPDDVGADGNR